MEEQSYEDVMYTAMNRLPDIDYLLIKIKQQMSSGNIKYAVEQIMDTHSQIVFASQACINASGKNRQSCLNEIRRIQEDNATKIADVLSLFCKQKE